MSTTSLAEIQAILKATSEHSGVWDRGGKMGNMEAKDILVFRIHRSYASKQQDLGGYFELVTQDTEYSSTQWLGLQICGTRPV